MRARQLSRIFCSLMLLFGSRGGHTQTARIQVEPWEVRINKRQPIDKVIETMGIKSGMVIGEVGAGTGRVTVWLADAVGPSGVIYANDINASALEQLKKRCAREGLNNVKTILGTVADPQLPPKTLDIAFMTNTYHHLEKPVELVRNLLPALKSEGLLVIVERDDERAAHKNEGTTRADFRKQMDEAGFVVIKTDTTMQEDNIYICRPKNE